jgi:hypothetical protein
MFGPKKLSLETLAYLTAGLSMFSNSAFSQVPRESTVEGSWSITFYLEPEHTQGGTQCVVFRTTRIERSGEERSGTWASPSFPGWHGEWQQDGDHVQWFGFTRAAALATSEFGHLPSNRIISGEFNHYIPPDGATSTAGGWVASRVKQCNFDATQNLTAHPPSEAANSDPAQR